MMTHKLSGMVFLALASCATCFGQSSFQDVTPGASTRNDVSRTLGQPVHSVSPTLVEYRAPAGIAKVEVEYSEGSVYAERVEVSLAKPVSREALAARFSLPSRADQTGFNGDGKFVEYFGSPALIVFTYATGEATSGGVAGIGYYSREWYEKSLRRLRGTPDITLLNAVVASLRFFPSSRKFIPLGARRYDTRFAGSQTTYIAWELNLTHPVPGQRIDFNIEMIIYMPDANVRKFPGSFYVDVGPQSSSTAHDSTVGWDQPGKWKTGIYRVELFVEGQRVAGGSFEIY